MGNAAPLLKTKTEETMGRIKEIFGLKFDKDVAALFGVNPVTLSERIKRGSLPYDKIIELCAKNGISLNYIFGLKMDFTPIQNFGAQAVHITKYTKGYSAFGDASCAEPFVFNNAYCADEHAKFSAVVADNILMFPIIDMGDTVIINENKREICEDGKLFLVNYKGTISVAKVLKTLEKDTYILQVENPLHKDITAKSKDLTILGKVSSVHSDF